MQSSEISQKYWEAFSPECGVYGFGGGKLLEALYRHFFELKHFENIAKLDKSFKILELGCGAGRWGLSLASKVEHYVGVDFSHSSLEYARSMATKRRLDNLEFKEASILDFHTKEEFDIVYFSGVSQCLSDEELLRALDNIKDMLTPRAVVIDRSTISLGQRQMINDGKYFSIYRTSKELQALFDSISLKHKYQKRSYRYLRGMNRITRKPKINKAMAKVVELTRPLSFYGMFGFSLMADFLCPEKEVLSHDFFVFGR